MLAGLAGCVYILSISLQDINAGARKCLLYCLSALMPMQVSWSARISTASSAEVRSLALHTPTSASLEFWEQHQDDRVLFNVGLVAQDGEQEVPVPINALDLAANSEWFRCLVKHLPVLCGTDLGSVTIPCSVSRQILEQGIVRAIYGSRVELDTSNVEAIYRAADAMQVSLCSQQFAVAHQFHAKAVGIVAKHQL